MMGRWEIFISRQKLTAHMATGRIYNINQLGKEFHRFDYRHYIFLIEIQKKATT
ncbi:MAG: hypothetical protein JSW35_08335 [Deltaproteobacteria bacterium]|nr:MAG: hypothetical protein JSW35_08335 [Deltaproteobacteria bacterium]